MTPTPPGPPTASIEGAPRGRLEAVDFWRGVILCTIFINHVPGNVFERLTLRNFGFSDSSEAFVFLSGLSLALAYGRKAMAGQQGAVAAGLGRRAVKLYALHLVLSVLGVAIFAAGAALTANADLMQVHGRELLADDPVAALVGLVSLGHQFGYFNILPLYVLLCGMAPVQFWLARRSVPLMLAASASLYLMTRAFGLNVPSWPMRGTWFFDPFAWQFLMALGIAVGLWVARAGRDWRPRPLALAFAGAVVLAGLFCATDGFGERPGLLDAARGWADLDKTSLGLGRLAHFLALAYLLQASGIARAVRNVAGYVPLCALGRHGLLTFALLSLLAAGAQVIGEAFGHALPLDAAVLGCGLATMVGAARWAERNAPVAALPAGLLSRR